jgi:tetratricopeptide (TPR) repeat protein
MKLCPYCNQHVEEHWSFCHNCNKPLIIDLESNFAATSSRENLEDDRSEISLGEDYYDFEVINDEEIEKKIREIDETLKEKEAFGEPIGQILLKKSSLFYKKRDLSSTVKVLESALKNFNYEKDLLNAAITHNEIGLIREEMGYFDDAIFQFDRALDNLKEIGDNKKMIQVYNNLGNVHFLVKELENSYKYYQKALKIAEQENLVFEEIKSSSNLVDVLFLLKDYDRIEKLLNRNATYFSEENDINGTIITLVKFGKLYYLKGEGYYDQSYQSLNDALLLINNIQDQISIYERAKLEWECFHYLGKLNTLYNDDIEAENYLLKSLEAIRTFEIGENIRQSGILEDLGKLFEIKGDYVRSIEYYSLSIEIYQKFGDNLKIAELKNEIAQIYMDFGDNESEALKNMEDSLNLYENLNYLKESADILYKLGNIHKNKGMFDLALSYYNRAKGYYEELSDETSIILLNKEINSLRR